MSWDPATPYNELPALPPESDLETIRVLKAVTEARVEVARLDQATHLIPHPHPAEQHRAAGSPGEF